MTAPVQTHRDIERVSAFGSLKAFSGAAASARYIAALPGAAAEWTEVAARIDAVCETLRKIVRPS
jgi:hypothetical protein